MKGIPRWSRDGRWICFTSSATGNVQVFRVSVDGGMPEQITRKGGIHGLGSEDGHLLYFSKHEGASPIWRVAVEREQTESDLMLVEDFR